MANNKNEFVMKHVNKIDELERSHVIARWQDIIHTSTTSKHFSDYENHVDLCTAFSLKSKPSATSFPFGYSCNNITLLNMLVDCNTTVEHNYKFKYSVYTILPDYIKDNDISMKELEKSTLKPIVFMGHADTVLSVEDWKKHGSEHAPGYHDDEKIYGPGALDMKGGLLLMFAVANIIGKIYPIKLIVTYDEETGHANNEVTDEIVGNIKGARFALNFETCDLKNNIIIRRAGRAAIKVTLTSNNDGHAGMASVQGMSIDKAISRIISSIETLNGDGTHKSNTDTPDSTDDKITLTIIHGGTHPNRLMQKVDLVMDARYFTKESNIVDSFVSMMDELNKELNESHISVSSNIVSNIPPMYNKKNLPLAEKFKKAVTTYLGKEKIGNAIWSYGASDSIFSAIANVPILDAMGVMGEYNHSPKEYALIDSFFLKGKCIVAFIADYVYNDVISIHQK